MFYSLSREAFLTEAIAKILKIILSENDKQVLKKKVSEVMFWLAFETTIDCESFVKILKKYEVTPSYFCSPSTMDLLDVPSALSQNPLFNEVIENIECEPCEEDRIWQKDDE